MLVSAFADAHHHAPVSTGVLPWHQSEPRREMPAILEVAAVADCRDHGRCRLRSNAAVLRNALAMVTGLKDGLNLLVKSSDALVDLKHERIQAPDSLAHKYGKLDIRLSEDLRNKTTARVAATPPIAMPRSSRRPRIWLINAVRWLTNLCRAPWSAWISCAPSSSVARSAYSAVVLPCRSLQHHLHRSSGNGRTALRIAAL